MYLRVVFPVKDWPGWLHKTLYFAPTTTPTTTTPSKNDTIITLNVDTITTSDYLSDSAVFRAHAPATAQWIGPIALKIALADGAQTSLQREADMYGLQLSPLQGHAVPTCYGLFRCIPVSELPVSILGQQNIKEDENGIFEIPSITLIAMEWWGECVDRPFTELSLSLRFIILAHLQAIHKRGLTHGDFAERNVLISSNDVRIIDFDLVESHECLCTIDFMALAQGASVTGQVQCEQLWECCNAMGIMDG